MVWLGYTTVLLYWNAESYWGSDIDTFKEEWVLDGETGTGKMKLSYVSKLI